MTGPFWSAREDHVLVTLRVTPNAREDRFDGPLMLADGRTVLAVRVRAVPEDGKANAAVCVLIAKALGLAKSRVAVVSGHTHRMKTLRIDSDTTTVDATLARLSDI